MHFVLSILWFFTTIQFSLAVCGYESCPLAKPNMLNVHIICHTHDDVGWVRTVDEYYHTYVKYIITSAINNLYVNETRRFIYVESAFLHRWWQDQSNVIKRIVRNLINDGRLEIISGGWSMNDEATTHYLAIIDQMTLGMRWLNSTFGKCATPRIGWQIDPFGHSREQASIFAQMNFDGLFLGRIDYQDKYWRQNVRKLEFIWKTHPGFGPNMNIFTGILPNVYWPPAGFCFDEMCGDPEVTDYDVHNRARLLMDVIRQQATFYRTNNTVLTMGMDFHYRNAERWYRNLDKLIQFINSLQDSGSLINMFYSTPSCYLYSLNQANLSWPTYSEDFFPYASDPDAYWTGYYTSKPSIKRYTRYSNAFLQACKQIIVLTNLSNEYSLNLQKAMGVLQHHDAVTGTEKDYVTKDYSLMLSEGIQDCEAAFNEAYNYILETNEQETIDYYFCHLLNVSDCYITENANKFVVTVYNPSSRNVTEYIRLPISSDNIYKVLDGSNTELPVQIVPITNAIQQIPEREGSANKELVFLAHIPALGISTYQVMESTEIAEDTPQETNNGDVTIGNEHIQIVIESRTGLLKEMVLDDGLHIPLRQSFYWYEAQPGFRNQRPSGAYAFNPRFDCAFSLHENVTFRVNKGPLVEEIHQTFTPWLSQTIRIYRGEKHVEFDWVVGPIPIDDRAGKEIITTYETSLATEGVFYTDSNARQTLRRRRNYRNSYPLNLTEEIASNYYPVNSWIHIKDENRELQLTIIPDRAQGGSSIFDGSIELMLHRRLLFDDGFGVDEPLNEYGPDGRGLIVRGKHWFLLRPTGDVLYRELAQRIFLSPILTFTNGNISEMTSLDKFSGLENMLPPNIHLLTLESLGENILLRLEHFYGLAENPVLSSPANVSLEELFSQFSITNVREMTLGGNMFLDEAQRLKWNEDAEESRSLEEPMEGLTFTFQPMQIRTFLLTINY